MFFFLSFNRGEAKLPVGCVWYCVKVTFTGDQASPQPGTVSLLKFFCTGYENISLISLWKLVCNQAVKENILVCTTGITYIFTQSFKLMDHELF